jgi:membrane-anchored mycosin MYCP
MGPDGNTAGRTPRARTPRGRVRRALATAAVPVLAGGLLMGLPASAVADEWRDQQYWLDDYGFRQAWETSRGEGVTVAVIDTGIDAGHPDLAGQVVGGTDVSGAGNAEGTQPVGETAEHGTLVASVLAGHGHTEAPAADGGAAEEDAEAGASDAPGASDATEGAGGEASPEPDAAGPGPDGVVGVAPEADLLSISVDLNAAGRGGPSAEDQIAAAVDWAVDHGADVINMSLGSTRQDWPESWDRAFLRAEEHDVVVVAAAGNRASGTMTAGAPATIPGVLTVAGLDPAGTASWDSSTEGISIGVAAPADPLVGAVPGGGHREWRGTSGAAPVVAGLAALVRSAHPEMPAHQVIHRILATAQDAGVPGVDPVYGHGVIDAGAAVAAEVAPVDRNPMDTISEWIRVHRRAEAPDPSPSSEAAGEPAGPASAPPPLATALPQASAPRDAAPGLRPALVVGTGLAAAVLAAIGVVVLVRRRPPST